MNKTEKEKAGQIKEVNKALKSQLVLLNILLKIVDKYPAKLERKIKRQIDKFIKDPRSLGEKKPRTHIANDVNIIKKS